MTNILATHVSTISCCQMQGRRATKNGVKDQCTTFSPAHGWLKELEEAESAVREYSTNVDCQIRAVHASLCVAVAAQTLRQWEKYKKAVQQRLRIAS